MSQKNLNEPFYSYNTQIIFTGVLFWLLITTVLLYHNADARQSTNCKKLRDGGNGAVGPDNIKCIQFIYVYGTSKISDENIYHSRRLYSSSRWWRVGFFPSPRTVFAENPMWEIIIIISSITCSNNRLQSSRW